MKDAKRRAAFLANLESCPRPLQRTDVKRLVNEFYALPDHGAGGSLHIVLDDGNTEIESIEYCVGYAQRAGDPVGEAFARFLLQLTQEQADEWLGKSYCLEMP